VKKAIRFSHRGTVLIFALLVVVVGAFVLAGWATMLATRSLHGDTSITAQQRRIAVANGRALARQYLLAGITNGSVAATTNPVALAGGWGGFSVTALAPIDVLSNSASTNPYNPFSPCERIGFENTVSGNITTSDTTNSWSFRIRARSPIYAGFPLVMQLPADTVPNNVTATSALLWTNSQNFDFHYSAYQSSAKLDNLEGGGAAISPFPYPPLASQDTAEGRSSFSGGILVTPLAAGIAPSTNGITTTNAPVQKAMLDLGAINVSSIPGATNVLIRYTPPANSAILELTGTPNAALPALHIVCTNTSSLTNISLIGNNSRRVYLSVVKDSGVTVTAPSAADWRLGALFQGCASTWTLGGRLTLTGGIRSSGNITVTSGSIDLQPDTDPGGLDSLADRIIWLEENRTE
jgi:hypothetical protein